MESNTIIYFLMIWGNGIGWYLVLRGIFIMLGEGVDKKPVIDVVLEEKPQEGAKTERKRGRPRGSKSKVSGKRGL